MGKLNFKTIDGKKFQIDVDLSGTVSDLQNQLNAEHDISTKAKLVYAGKVLDKARTLESYGLTDGDRKTIVIATAGKPAVPAGAKTPKPASNPTAAAAATPVTPAASSSAQPGAPEKKQPEDRTAARDSDVAMNESTVTAAETSTSSTSASASQAAGTAMVTPTDPHFTEMIQMLCEMTGADVDKVERALAASYNNPDRAAELLFTGAPLPTREQIAQAQRPQQPAATQSSRQSSGGSGASQELTPSQASTLQLLAQPQFAMLRDAVQKDPSTLEPLLEQLGNENPDLLRLLNENQEILFAFVNSTGDVGAPPGSIKVTPEEKAAIERLQALGFARDLAIQAYFACEKDEDAAANFLYLNRDFGEDD